MNERPRILVSESKDFSVAAADMLRRAGDLMLADVGRADLLRAVRDCDVLWVRLRHLIDAEVMQAGPRLKVIATATTGLNHIDLDEARRRGIAVVSLRGEAEFLKDIRATAEHTVALALAVLRNIPAATQHAVDGGWDRDRFKGHELYRKTAGIVGYGRLGRIVARYFAAFGMRVLVTDPHVNPQDMDPGVEAVSLDGLLHAADVVTLHVSYSEETRGFFGARQFAAMKPRSWFINTARGELVDEQALVDALEAGRLAGAAVDVLADENHLVPDSNPLIRYARQHRNLVITPHIGGCTEESMSRTEEFIARRVLAALCVAQGGPGESAAGR